MNCQHQGCRCQDADQSGFCSDYCRQHAGEAAHEDHACACGHPDCS
jgi:hypothetical protein